MAQERKVADVWVYNTCVRGGEAYVLLGKRENYENLFWHVASQGVFQGTDAFPSRDLLVRTAHVANMNELQLDTKKAPSGAVDLVFVDCGKGTTWTDGVIGAHVWINHGHVNALPPIIPTVYRTPVGSMKGLSHAEWVKVSDSVVLPIDQRQTEILTDHPLRRAASDRVFYKGLPLRSMVATVLGGHVLPAVLAKHDCSPACVNALQDMMSPYVTRFTERLPDVR